MAGTRYQLVGQAPAPVAERPKCKMCGKPLRPNWRHTWAVFQSGLPNTKEWDGTYGDKRGSHHGLFCGVNCGYWWAVKTIEAIRKGELKIKSA